MAGVGPSAARSPRCRTSCFVRASLPGQRSARSAASAIRHGSIPAVTSSHILSDTTGPPNSSRPARSVMLLCTPASGSPNGGRRCCVGLHCRDRGPSRSRSILRASGGHLRRRIRADCPCRCLSRRQAPPSTSRRPVRYRLVRRCAGLAICTLAANAPCECRGYPGSPGSFHPVADPDLASGARP